MEIFTRDLFHTHNKVDSPGINFDDIDRKKIYIFDKLQGTSAAVAANYGVFFIAPDDCYVESYRECHGTAASAGTIDLENLSDGTAPGSGVSVLTSTVNFANAANNVQTGTVSLVSSNIALERGDRLAHKVTGALTNLSDVSIMVTLVLS